MKEQDDIRTALAPLMGAPHLPRDVRGDLADAHDATDFEATLYRTAAALVAMEALAERVDAEAKAVRAALLNAMAETGAPNIALPHHTVGTQERRALHITEAELPAIYMRQPPPAPDTSAIRKALAAGDTIPGATLGNGAPSLFIRARNAK